MSSFLENLVARSQDATEAIQPRRRTVFESSVHSPGPQAWADGEAQEIVAHGPRERPVASKNNSIHGKAPAASEPEPSSFRPQVISADISPQRVDPSEKDVSRHVEPVAAETPNPGIRHAQRTAPTEKVVDRLLVTRVESPDWENLDQRMDSPPVIRPTREGAKRSLGLEQPPDRVETTLTPPFSQTTPVDGSLQAEGYVGKGEVRTPLRPLDVLKTRPTSSPEDVAVITQYVEQSGPSAPGSIVESKKPGSDEATSPTLVPDRQTGRREQVEVVSVIQPRKAEVTQLSTPPVERSEAPTIHVSIGRVEVRAVTPPPKSRRHAERRAPALSLDDYLKRDRRAG